LRPLVHGALVWAPLEPKFVALLQQLLAIQSVRTRFAQKYSKCHGFDLAPCGAIVVNSPVKWDFVRGDKAGTLPKCQRRLGGRTTTGAGYEKSSHDGSGGGAFGLRGFWR